MVLPMQDIQVFVFHEEGFQLPTSSQCREMIENADIAMCFLKEILQHVKG